VSEPVVRAAGGVVTRAGRDELEVVVVHRPEYDDWTLPKGKAKRGESDEACALREVAEETGLQCELQSELASTSYHDSAGRPKIVRYWLMRPAKGELHPADEVDDARWLPLEDAFDLLSYERDRDVLRSLREI
jgi:8-oxo-dGTP pyrophosphatase MutT (NUDIX family)